MGLFDKLLKEVKEAVNENISEEDREKAKNLLGNLKETFGNEIETIKKAVDDYKAEQKEKEENKIPEEFYEDYEDGKTARQRILDILAEEFPQYNVYENVSPAEMGGDGRFMDYSIIVCEGNEVKLVIMLIGKTTTAHREYRWSREFAEDHGIQFINFVEHYPNHPEYIKQRLHKYL
ncbi:MAG: hypothetical protein IJG59_04675 [Erysipelotrichaceae bacterium]|nr:hypothetical protein [Erysipelotrichaceae bacterium]